MLYISLGNPCKFAWEVAVFLHQTQSTRKNWYPILLKQGSWAMILFVVNRYLFDIGVGDTTTFAFVVQKEKLEQGQNTYYYVGAKIEIRQGLPKSLRPGNNPSSE